MFVDEPGTTPAPNDPATALQRGRGTRPIPGRTRSYLRDTPRLKRLFSTDRSVELRVTNPGSLQPFPS